MMLRSAQNCMAAGRDVRCRGMKENVANLPSINGIARVRIPQVSHSVENVEGKKASVAIYAHLAKAHNGKLNKASAAEGVELYAEKAEEARQHAGSHPNIDLLFRVIAENATYDIVVDAS